MNTFPLEGKTAIITGGLGGYGLAITGLILKRGGQVLCTDLKNASEGGQMLAQTFKEEFEAKKVLYAKCDVTLESDLDLAFKVAQDELVRPDEAVDILINNAGIVGERDWQKLYDVNIVSVSFSDLHLCITLHLALELLHLDAIVTCIGTFAPWCIWTMVLHLPMHLGKSAPWHTCTLIHLHFVTFAHWYISTFVH